MPSSLLTVRACWTPHADRTAGCAIRTARALSRSRLFAYNANMLITVEPAARTSLADQVAAQIRHAIARGEFRNGERLPSARELAAAVDVNMHTVLRAYAQLQDDGLIELRRGRGATVLRSGNASFDRLRSLVVELREQAETLGVPLDDLYAMIKGAR
jgi:GntR family transcriptional regulator